MEADWTSNLLDVYEEWHCSLIWAAHRAVSARSCDYFDDDGSGHA